jgi:hypothetical protein
LTAVSLFDKGKFLPNAFDRGKALSLSFEVLVELVAMRAAAAEFDAAQQNACTKAKADGSTMQIPFIGDVKTPCRAFMQQAHHAAGSLLALPPDVADPDAVARMVVRTHRKLRFAGDSPQPRRRETDSNFSSLTETGKSSAIMIGSFLRDRWFEPCSLQEGVHCELDPGGR